MRRIAFFLVLCCAGAAGLCPLLRLPPVRLSLRLGRAHGGCIQRDPVRGTATLARAVTDAVVFSALAGDSSSIQDVVVSEAVTQFVEYLIFLLDKIHLFFLERIMLLKHLESSPHNTHRLSKISSLLSV